MARRKVVRVVFLFILILVLIFVAGKLITDWQVRRGAEMYPSDGRLLEVNGLWMNYVSVGEGSPIVFIHGMSGVHQDFLFGVIDSLRQDHQCIAFDRPGAGYSGAPPLDSISIGINTRYLHEAIKKLGIKRPVLVGHSYGGAVALAYALWYPEDVAGLVLLAPAAYPVDKRIEKILHPLLWTGATPFLAETIYVPLRTLVYPFAVDRSATPDMVPAEYVRLKQHINIDPRNFLVQIRELETLDENLARLAPEYGRLTLPVTIIVGEQDQILPPQQQAIALAKAIKRAKLVTIPRAGHLLPQCRGAEVVPYIRNMANAVAGKED